MQPKSPSMTPNTLITSPIQLPTLERNLEESQENRIEFHGWIREFLRLASRTETKERGDLREIQKSVAVRIYCQE